LRLRYFHPYGRAKTKKLARSALLACTALAWGFLATAAQAAPTMQLSIANDPVESVPTQLGASGAGVDTTNGASVFVTVKPAGGSACAANSQADDGSIVVDGDFGRNPTYASTQNWTFQTAGSYLLCGWLAPSGNSSMAVAQASQMFTVRQPHLSLTISAPAAVQTGQTFQVATTAQAETQRPAYVYALPDTGSGCPANAAAASDTSGSQTTAIDPWLVIGGPLMQTINQSFNSAGRYLFCGYFQYPNNQSPPEASTTVSVTVVAPPPPCVVPSFGANLPVASVQQSVKNADCVVGTVRYAASQTVPRGDVVSLTPSPGSHLAPAAAVNVLVSTGPPCVVPAVKAGSRLSVAQRAIRASHCSVGRVSHTRSARVRAGTVVRLSPGTHSRLASGALVAIVVSKGRR
jgi:hypothetical protein